MAASAAVPLAALTPRLAHSTTPPIALLVENRVIEVNRKAASMLKIGRENGISGLFTEVGRRFHVTVENWLTFEKTLIHWHGLTPDYKQDGVPNLSQPVLESGGTYEYDFPLTFPGTFWMHSHYELQAQQLLAAPLIVRDPTEAHLDEQEVIVMLHDFSFRDPDEIYADLRKNDNPAAQNHIEYDAYLANERTLDDPQVIRVEPGGRIRLRIINAGAGTNFHIDLGELKGDVIAVDGHKVAPLRGRRFPIAMSQRLDIRLTLPAGQGVYPILALREGDVQRCGVLLSAGHADIKRMSVWGARKAAVLGLDFERRLVASDPLSLRPVDRIHIIDLTGDPAGYVWSLNGVIAQYHTPLEIAAGERVEIVFRNTTAMSHPMHLHGHAFQVVKIDGRRMAGAKRDTVLVPPNGTQVTIAFDADNPGNWLMHCHNIYHMKAGMQTTLRYVDMLQDGKINSR